MITEYINSFSVQSNSELSISRTGSNNDLANHICYNAEYRNAELQFDETHFTEDDEKESVDLSDEDESDEDCEDVVENDKYLIFITGYKTYSPHQIGCLNNLIKQQ